MTEYTDVPVVNQLHLESQQVAQARANLEQGGNLVSMTIGSPPATPGQPMPMMMSVMVSVPPPTNPVLVVELIKWLDARLVELAAQMAALGVTVPPPEQMLTRRVA